MLQYPGRWEKTFFKAFTVKSMKTYRLMNTKLEKIPVIVTEYTEKSCKG